MTIPKCAESDAGAYTAEATNEVGAVRTTGNIEVDVKPEIVKGLKDDEIVEGDDHTFVVEVNTPVRSVKWLVSKNFFLCYQINRFFWI